MDGGHAVVKVPWEAAYEKQDGSKELPDFDVIYLVQMIGDNPKIFGYITGDEKKLYKERGLISQQIAGAARGPDSDSHIEGRLVGSVTMDITEHSPGGTMPKRHVPRANPCPLRSRCRHQQQPGD